MVRVQQAQLTVQVERRPNELAAVVWFRYVRQTENVVVGVRQGLRLVMARRRGRLR